MSKKTRSARRSGCPISVALEIFGDTWSLLIVRDLMFKDLRTFNEFASSGEGIASNVLSERLVRLEAAGILVKEPDPVDGRRSRYRLAEKGVDLAPALIEIILWAARHEKTDAPASTVRAMRSSREQFIADVRKAVSPILDRSRRNDPASSPTYRPHSRRNSPGHGAGCPANSRR